MLIQKLIEKQRTMWKIRQRLDETHLNPGCCVLDGVPYGPCLLISREHGSGGTVVAHAISERLGWNVYDREIVAQIADSEHVQKKLVESVDEKVRTRWENTWRQMLFPEDVSTERYLRCLHDVILTLGHNGDVIILGRGAQYLLPASCSLRVRLIAPLEKRAQRVSENQRLTKDEAIAFVQRIDKEQAHFIQKYFHSDLSAPQNYDLVLNTEALSVSGTVNVILATLEAKLGITCPV